MLHRFAVLLLAGAGFLSALSAQITTPTLSSTEVEVPFNIGPVKADPVRNIVYMIDSSNSRLIAIDLSSGQQVYAASVDDGTTTGDMAISVDDSTLYLAESNRNEIMVFSLPSLSPLPTLPLNFSPGGHRVCGQWGDSLPPSPTATLSGNFLLAEIDPATGNALQTFGVSDSYQTPPLLRINASGTDLYASTPDVSGLMYEYNLNNSPFTAPTSYQFDSDNLKDFSPDETYGRVYLESEGVYGIQLLLTASDDFSTVWPFTGAYGVAVSYNPGANIVYGGSGDPSAGDIRTFNRTDGTPLNDYVVCTDTWAVKPRGLAATANGNALYLRALASANGMSVIGVLGSLTAPVTLFPTVMQTITFPSLGTQSAGTAIVLQATDSAGLPIVYSVVSGPAIISGNTVVFTGIGTVVIAASQAGDSVHLSTRTTQTITVVGKVQTIAPFATISTQTYGVSPLTITPPLSTSGLAVTVTVQSGPATISGNSLTITGAGTVTLAANQAGNNFYAPATQVTTSFTVNKENQSIAGFKTIATQTYGTSPITITIPTASSGLPVTVTVLSGPATLSGTSLTLTSAGYGRACGRSGWQCQLQCRAGNHDQLRGQWSVAEDFRLQDDFHQDLHDHSVYHHAAHLHFRAPRYGLGALRTGHHCGQPSDYHRGGNSRTGGQSGRQWGVFGRTASHDNLQGQKGLANHHGVSDDFQTDLRSHPVRHHASHVELRPGGYHHS